jgi:hypothetical protein
MKEFFITLRTEVINLTILAWIIEILFVCISLWLSNLILGDANLGIIFLVAMPIYGCVLVLWFALRFVAEKIFILINDVDDDRNSE